MLEKLEFAKILTELLVAIVRLLTLLINFRKKEKNFDALIEPQKTDGLFRVI